ncbi:MAG: hypothetical protein K2Y40_13320 [Reyranella sp.]|jgi:hypothetical protein|nr:hypothetical protein [Reyranella sp.]
MGTEEEGIGKLTLGEAIARLRATDDPSGEVTAAMNAAATHAFEQHDAVHVLFSCGTSVQDEIAAHVWMALGTTARLGEMHRAVASAEHRQVLSGIGHLRLVGIWVTSLPRILGIAFRALRMKKKVAFERLDELKGRSVVSIRQEHGIIV